MSYTLPFWATEQQDSDLVTKIFVDPNVVYPLYLQELGFDISRQGVEVAMRCMIEDLKVVPGLNSIHVKIIERLNWKLTNLPNNPQIDDTKYLQYYAALVLARG